MGNKKCGIYCIENTINNKKYIGQSVNIYYRWREHRYDLRHNIHFNIHLQNAWNSYKEENFRFYILEECIEDALNEREIYYISHFNANDKDFGYNVELGGHEKAVYTEEYRQLLSQKMSGEGNPFYGKHHSDETRQYLSEINKGKPGTFLGRSHTEETRKKMSENHVDVSGKNHPMYGKHHSNETKQKISQSRTGQKGISGEQHYCYGKPHTEEWKRRVSDKLKGPNSPCCKAVYCPELNRIFWGGMEVERELGISHSAVSACCMGKRKFAGHHPETGEELHWRYTENINTIQND